MRLRDQSISTAIFYLLNFGRKYTTKFYAGQAWRDKHAGAGELGNYQIAVMHAATSFLHR